VLSNLIRCDATGFITTAQCEYSGNTSDSHIFKMSAAYRATERFSGIDTEAAYPDGYTVVMDSGFAQREWLMTPFSDRWVRPPPHGSVNFHACRLFNFRPGQIRVTSENCFSRLKGRWSILRGLSFKPQMSSKVVFAACCLHNFAETRKETALQCCRGRSYKESSWKNYFTGLGLKCFAYRVFSAMKGCVGCRCHPGSSSG
jgi:DDE superfamily endonuclease